MTAAMEECIERLEKLLTPGVIGTYRSFEVTEIFVPVDKQRAFNILSLIVAEPDEAPSDAPQPPAFINGEHASKIPKTNLTYGIARYRISLQRMLETLHRYGATGEWQPGVKELGVGKLIPIQPQFIPADTYLAHPWNGVLKNNFWLGSHVLELFDTEKVDVKFLFDNPAIQTELVQQIRKIMPVGLDALSDRLGNIVIQLPVTVAVETLGRDSEGEFPMVPIWHADAPPAYSR